MKCWQGLLAALVVGMIAGGIGGYNCAPRDHQQSLNPITPGGLLRLASVTPKQPARTVLVKVPKWYERTVKVPEVRWRIVPATDTVYIPAWKLTRVEVRGNRVWGVAVKEDSALAFDAQCGWRNRFSIHAQDDGARASDGWLPFDVGLWASLGGRVALPDAGWYDAGAAAGVAFRYKAVQVQVGPGWSLRDGFTARVGAEWRTWF